MRSANRVSAAFSAIERVRLRRTNEAVRDLDSLTRAPELLGLALSHVMRRGQAAGVDGVVPGTLEVDAQLEMISSLESELKSGAYVPAPLRAAYVSSGGRKRPIAVPTVRDRVAQTASRFVLEPILETRFSESSFGFRPGRGPHAALLALLEYLENADGGMALIRLDIRRAFGSVSHRRVFRELRKHVRDERVIRRIRQWLKAPVSTQGETRPTTRGLLMGLPIAPLVFNVIMTPFDRYLEERGDFFVRFADDVVAAVPSAVTQAWLAQVQDYLRDELGLVLSLEKTRVVPLGGELEFLGFTIGLVPGGAAWIQPGERARADLARAIRAAVTSVEQLALPTTMKLLNDRVLGWASYFLDLDAVIELVNAELEPYLNEAGLVVATTSRGDLHLAPIKTHLAHEASGGDLSSGATAPHLATSEQNDRGTIQAALPGAEPGEPP